MKIYLMRHGRSLADDEQKLEGRYDSPLTLIGKEQASKRADYFIRNGINFDQITASPLSRARETAEIIAGRFGLEVKVIDCWAERDNGVLAGLTFTEADHLYPHLEFRGRFEKFPNNSGESAWELYRRAIEALNGIVNLNLEKVLVVAHGNIINAVLRLIVGAPPMINDQIGVAFSLGDCGYIETEYNRSKEKWTIRNLHNGEFN